MRILASSLLNLQGQNGLHPLLTRLVSRKHSDAPFPSFAFSFLPARLSSLRESPLLDLSHSLSVLPHSLTHSPTHPLNHRASGLRVTSRSFTPYIATHPCTAGQNEDFCRLHTCTSGRACAHHFCADPHSLQPPQHYRMSAYASPRRQRHFQLEQDRHSQQREGLAQDEPRQNRLGGKGRHFHR